MKSQHVSPTQLYQAEAKTRYVQHKKNELREFIKQLNEFDKELESFKQNFYQHFSKDYIETIESLKKYLTNIQSQTDSFSELKILSSLVAEQFKKCHEYLDLLITKQALLSEHCYHNYAVPLVDCFWNAKFSIELDHAIRLCALKQTVSNTKINGLPSELLTSIFVFLDSNSQRNLRLMSSRFKSVIDQLKGPSFYLAASLWGSFQDEKISVSGYRKLLDEINSPEVNAALSLNSLKKIKRRADERRLDMLYGNQEVCERRERERFFKFLNMSLSIFAGAFACFFLLKLMADRFIIDKDKILLPDECGGIDEALLTVCENALHKIFKDSLIAYTLSGATIGFAAKLIDRFLYSYYLENELPNLLRNADKPPVFLDNIRYPLFQLLEKRDYGSMLTSAALTVALAVEQPLQFDALQCSHEGSPYMDVDCLNKKAVEKIHDVRNLSISNGFMMAYSSVTLLYLLYRLVEKFARSAMNSNNSHRFFARPNEENLSLLESQSARLSLN